MYKPCFSFFVPDYTRLGRLFNPLCMKQRFRLFFGTDAPKNNKKMSFYTDLCIYLPDSCIIFGMDLSFRKAELWR